MSEYEIRKCGYEWKYCDGECGPCREEQERRAYRTTTQTPEKRCGQPGDNPPRQRILNLSQEVIQ